MPDRDDDAPHRLGITALAAAYRQGRLGPVEVTQHLLDRLHRLNPRLRAWLTPTPEIALAQARQAQAEMQRGVFRGPLHGVPLGIKDLCLTAGVPTSRGGILRTGLADAEDATVVRRLAEAGAVMLGKLHLTEGAFAEHHPRLPAPLNPWGAGQWAGSSSSGSGVALAARLCAGAIGTDTGGSIRFPSGANGVCGLKPTYGRVSRHGVLPLADTLDHVGPMARSAADAGAMLDAMAGPDPLDPTALAAAAPGCLAAIGGLAGLDAPIALAGLRVGTAPDDVAAVCDSATQRVLAEAGRVLASLGATLQPVALPPGMLAMAQQWETLCSVETAIAHAATYPRRAADYGPVLASLIRQGRQTSGLAVMQVVQARAVFSGALQHLMQTVDVLLLPVHPFGNPTLARLDALTATASGVDDLMRWTAPFDMSGSPTLTLPAGADDDGLPIGVQLVGRHLDEASLVRAGHAFQQATDWHRREPAGPDLG